ncbi:MAG TPA: hypothetical protein VMV02_01320 [Acidimicrobiales bacterium]|nr:hypothetical protein [Acidimicrobiales bacterium]
MVDSLQGASTWEQEVYDQIRSHIAAEAGFVDTYGALADDVGSPDITYLARLIMEDEQRHHRVFEELASSMRAEVELRSAEDGVPDVAVVRRNSTDLVERTERLLELEREDLKSLKHLRRSLDPVSETTLWALLVETMELDTRKHIAILRHIRKIARGMTF